MDPGEGNPFRDDGLREDAAAWLARLRGPSTAEDRAAFEAWYQAAPEHAEAYDAVLRTWEDAGLAALTPAGRSRAALAPGIVYRWRYALAAVAATVVIAVVAFGAYGEAIVGSVAGRPVEFASRAGRIRTIELADGSRVTLDGASRLEARYSPDERRIELLRGRARFAVAHNRARPFVVATRLGLVIAHGTVFDVALAGPRLTVSLLKGSVEVRRTASGRPGASRMLTAGQRVTVDAREIGPPTRSSVAQADWTNGMVSLEDAPLGQAIAAANRYGADRIVLSDPALARLRFTGTFRAADTERFARLVADSFGLGLWREEGGAFVLSPPGAAAARERKKIPG